LPPDDLRIAVVLERLANVYAIEHYAAELLLKRALFVLEKRNPANDAAIIQAQAALAGRLVAQRKYQEAEPLLAEVIRYVEKTPNSSKGLRSAFGNYATVLEFSGRPLEAAEMQKRFLSTFDNLR
jgi:hypothetical protein